MTEALPLIIAPHPIFRTPCTAVSAVDDRVRALMDRMLHTLHQQHGIGLGAPMVGVSQRIVVIHMQEENSEPLFMVNPEITSRSEETQSFAEASLSFPGIEAEITRPSAITVRFLDYNGAQQELQAKGFLATVIQHEMDYLDGKTFLSHLSRIKQDMLLKKMEKFKKNYRPHVHGPGCSH